MSETIRVERDGERALVTLNRPEQRNGITQMMLDELHAALKEAAADENLRVLVLTGAGRDFCPGADVKHYASGGGGRSNPLAFHISTLLHDMPAVTIAAIRGACAGAGLGWAAACDLRVASNTARFNTAFLDVGLSGDMGGAWLLPRILGAAKARELYFLPGKFESDEALRIGLVSRVWPLETFDAELERMVGRIAGAAPIALRHMKANFLDGEQMSLSDFITLETQRHSACAATEDSKEAFRAFVEKRRPVYGGR
jgi:2-(1,2-epoxy-1,2-dihydrophenyl)acetyl-CoA isomerase